MQAWANAAALEETLRTGLATFYSRSRQERWCKGETSGNLIKARGSSIVCSLKSLKVFVCSSRLFLVNNLAVALRCNAAVSLSQQPLRLARACVQVVSVHPDCDGDSIVYLAEPQGPSCHTNARTCWFTEAVPDGSRGAVLAGEHTSSAHVPRSTLLELEHTIAQRQRDAQEQTGVKALRRCTHACRHA